jgi:hypothetical protein
MGLQELDQQIQHSEAHLTRLREQREQLLAEQNDLYELAEFLHTVECKQNHTDGCGWGYEYKYSGPDRTGGTVPDWDGWAHKRYLARAHKVFIEIGIKKEAITEALDLMKRLQDL